MILNLTKDFFFTLLICYILLDAIGNVVYGCMGRAKTNVYSVPDGIVVAAICVCWLVA